MNRTYKIYKYLVRPYQNHKAEYIIKIDITIHDPKKNIYTFTKKFITYNDYRNFLTAFKLAADHPEKWYKLKIYKINKEKSLRLEFNKTIDFDDLRWINYEKYINELFTGENYKLEIDIK